MPVYLLARLVLQVYRDRVALHWVDVHTVAELSREGTRAHARAHNDAVEALSLARLEHEIDAVAEAARAGQIAPVVLELFYRRLELEDNTLLLDALGQADRVPTCSRVSR